MGTVTPANHTELERYWQGKLHAKTNGKHGNKEVWQKERRWKKNKYGKDLPDDI